FGRGLELFPIRLGAEGVHVAADLGGVFGEFLRAQSLVGGGGGVAVGLVGGLGGDDGRRASGEGHDRVGAEAAGLGGDGFLFVEVAVGGHAGELDDAAQLEFAPGAGGGDGAERGGEAGGLGLELDLGGVERLELFGEGAVGLGAGLFDEADLAVHFFEGFAQGFDEFVDGLAALFEVAGGLLAELSEGFLGEVEEALVVAGEGVGGEGLEFGGEAFVGLGEGFEAFGGGGAFGGEVGGGGGELVG